MLPPWPCEPRSLRSPFSGSSRACYPLVELLITEFIKDVSPLLPNPCYFQDYDRSMLSPDKNAPCIQFVQISHAAAVLSCWLLELQGHHAHKKVPPPPRITIGPYA